MCFERKAADITDVEINITIQYNEVVKPPGVSAGYALLLVSVVNGCNFSCMIKRTARRGEGSETVPGHGPSPSPWMHKIMLKNFLLQNYIKHMLKGI